MNQNTNLNLLLERIPKEKLSTKQKEFLPKEINKVPFFKVHGEPTNVADILWRGIAIWCDNETLIGSFCASEVLLQKKCVRFNLQHGSDADEFLFCAIYGDTDAAIAETAAWFWSLPHLGDGDPAACLLEIDEVHNFDFATALQPKQLEQILDSNPKRHYHLCAGMWSAEQSVILATRPYPLNLTLHKYHDGQDTLSFDDFGAAFVDAIQSRQSRFGSLDYDSPFDFLFSLNNLKRLLGLDGVLEKLTITSNSLHGENILFPLSAKVDALNYTVEIRGIQAEDFQYLDISTKNLSLKTEMESTRDGKDILISLLNRVAELGHFESFGLTIAQYWLAGPDNLKVVTKALAHAIHANPNLTHFTFNIYAGYLDWTSSLQTIFDAMEGHNGVRTFTLDIRHPRDDFYAMLERFLSRNRNIAVLHGSGKRITNGTTINSIYSLNSFYNGSAALVKASVSLRLSLVTTALLNSGDFQLAALLLVNHTDILYEFMDGVNANDIVADDAGIPVAMEEATSPDSLPTESRRKAASKRTKAQPPRAAKESSSKLNLEKLALCPHLRHKWCVYIE